MMVRADVSQRDQVEAMVRRVEDTFGPVSLLVDVDKRQHEYNAQVKDDLFTTPERPFEGADDYEEGAKHSSVLDLLLPVIVLIALCIVGLVWTGGMWDTESCLFYTSRCV